MKYQSGDEMDEKKTFFDGPVFLGQANELNMDLKEINIAELLKLNEIVNSSSGENNDRTESVTR